MALAKRIAALGTRMLKVPICLMRLANKFAAVSKVHDLITCESKVQVVVSPGSYEALFAQGRHEVLTSDT